MPEFVARTWVRGQEFDEGDQNEIEEAVEDHGGRIATLETTVTGHLEDADAAHDATAISSFHSQVQTNRLDQMAAPTAAVSLNSQRITNLSTPSGNADAATKQYVDSVAAGLTWKAPVRIATTAAGTLATDFDNGTTVDGVALATGDRILIKNQVAAAENGIYIVAASGAPTRSTDANEAAELVAGTAVFVTAGTTNAQKQYVQTTTGVIVVDTTGLVFEQFGAATGVDPVMGGDLTGNASNAQIAAGAVGTTELAATSVTMPKISASGTASSATFLRGDGVWATPDAGTAPTTWPGTVLLTDFAGATDTVKMQAAMTYAAAQTRKPAILIPPGTSFVAAATAPFLLYDGFRMIGTTNGEPANTTDANCLVTVTGSGALFRIIDHVPGASPHTRTSYCTIEGINFSGNSNVDLFRQGDNSDTSIGGVLAYSKLAFSATGFRTIFYGQLLGCTISGGVHNSINNTTDTPWKLWASDCYLWPDGGFLDSPNLADSEYLLYLAYANRTYVGPLYITADGPTPLRVDSGRRMKFMGLIGEAQGDPRPTAGAAIRWTGGEGVFYNFTCYQVMQDPTSVSHLGAIHVTGNSSLTLVDPVFEEDASETYDHIYCSGSNAKVYLEGTPKVTNVSGTLDDELRDLRITKASSGRVYRRGIEYDDPLEIVDLIAGSNVAATLSTTAVVGTPNALGATTTRLRRMYPRSRFRQARFEIAHGAVVGATAATVVRPQYSTDGSTWSYLEASGTGLAETPQVNGAGNHVTSSWVDLASGFYDAALVYLRVVEYANTAGSQTLNVLYAALHLR